jgi:hypothetical protein
LPRYLLIFAGSSERAWARANAQPQISAYSKGGGIQVFLHSLDSRSHPPTYPE